MAIGDEINKLGREATEALSALDAIQNSAKAKANELEDVSAQLINSSISNSKKLATQLSKVDQDTVKSLKEQKRIRDAARESQREIAKLERQGNYFLQRSLTADAKKAKIYRKLSEDYYNAADNLARQAEAAQELVESFDKLNRSTKFFEAMADIVDEVPVLRKLFSEFREAAKASEEAGGGKDGFLAGLVQLSRLALKTVVGFLVKGFSRMDNLIVDIGRGLGVAGQKAQSINNAILSTGMRFKESKESVLAFQKALGSAAAMSPKLAQAVTVVQSRMGLSAEAAASLFEVSTLTGQSLEDTASNIAGMNEIQNALNGRSFSFLSIMNDVAQASEYTRLSISKFDGGIAKAAFTARKLGLTFSLLEGSSSSLLDFESSISAELEAELMLGKQLNLQKARELAMQGDLAGLAEEITKQVGTEEEFLAMSVYQREALAKAMGTTKEELAKSFAIRRRDAKLADIMNNATFEKLKMEKQLRVIEGQGYTRQEAMAKLQEKLGDQAYNQALTQQTTLEKIEQLLDTLINSYGKDIMKIITPVGNMIDGMIKGVDFIKASLKALASLPIFANLMKLFGGGEEMVQAKSGKMYKASSPQGKMIQNMAKKEGGGLLSKLGLKGGMKMGGKALSKLAPGVGLVFALQAFAKGDTTSGILNLISGIASFFPGVGTGIAAAASALDIGRDFYKASNTTEDTTEEQKMATGGIVTRPTRALVGEAGAEAVVPLNEFYAKMDELIQVVKSNNGVYIDGRRVDEVVRMNRINQ